MKSFLESKWTGLSVKVLAVSLSLAISFNFGKTYEEHSTTNQVVARNDSLEAEVVDLLEALQTEGRVETVLVALPPDTLFAPGPPIIERIPGPPETTVVLHQHAVVDTVTIRQTVLDTIKVDPDPTPAWQKDRRRVGVVFF